MKINTYNQTLQLNWLRVKKDAPALIRIELVPFIPLLDLVLFYGLLVKLFRRTSFQTLELFPVFIAMHYISVEHTYKLEHILTSQKSVCYRAVFITAFVYIWYLQLLQFYNIHRITHPSAWTEQSLPEQSILRMGLLLETESYQPAGKLILALIEGFQICYAATECKEKQLVFELPP